MALAALWGAAAAVFDVHDPGRLQRASFAPMLLAVAVAAARADRYGLKSGGRISWAIAAGFAAIVFAGIPLTALTATP